MPDTRETDETPAPKPDGTTKKVDEAVQEQAGEERAKTGGYE